MLRMRLLCGVTRRLRTYSLVAPPFKETTEPLANTMSHIMSATLRRKAATLELAALVEGRGTPLASPVRPPLDAQAFHVLAGDLTSRHHQQEKATTRLIELIEDHDYEVRALAIKFALKALQSDASLLYEPRRTKLQPVIEQRH
jgi:hypothetical protein